MNTGNLTGLVGPVSWGPPRPRVPAKTLTLAEVLIVRRQLARVPRSDIAAELGRSSRWVSNRLQQARKRFGAATLEEFYRMPELREAIKEKP